MLMSEQVVGYNPALTLSYDLVRPFGVIASVGVHQSEALPLTVSVVDLNYLAYSC